MAFERNFGSRAFDASIVKRVNSNSAEEPGNRRRPSNRPLAVNDQVIRILDLTIASLALIFLLPLMLVVAVICKVQDGGPILFAQSRCGSNGRRFACLKFRSMVVDADARLAQLLKVDPCARAEWEATHKLTNDPRITRCGRFLRASSIDELPQLFNVIRGEMSLVGPRPIVPNEMVRYGRYMADYNRILPGITGLWQISGRSDTTYRRRVALDVLYTRKRSLRVYLYILVMTVPAVLVRKGAR